MKKWFNTYKEKYKKAEKGQRGSIIVEATIILPIFIFLIFSILSIVDICYVQAKIAVAVNSASKEMSQYAYLYHTLNLDEYLDSGEGGKSSELLQGFSKLLTKVSDGTANFSEDVSTMFSTASNAANNDSIGSTAKDQLIGGGIARQLVKKNLVAFEGDDADSFLKRCRVVDGLNGLNFVYTSFLNDPDHDLVDIVVTYKVQVIKLLGIDYKFTFVQRAQSGAWGKGGKSSVVESGGSGEGEAGDVKVESIWDSGDFPRGKEIVKMEKRYYKYTSDNGGFHAYNQSNNEFVRIISADSTADSYNNPATAQQNYKNVISRAFNTMYNAVDDKNTIEVKHSSEKKVTLSTGDDKSYKVVLVVPEGTDLTAANAAARAYEKDCAENGINVKVQVKADYGSPSAAQSKNTDVTE